MSSVRLDATSKIAIIGGGPAGLALARILQMHGFRPTVYERDAADAARSSQGGSLDLHSRTGQRALRMAGLYAEFLKRVQTGADALTIQSDQGATTYTDGGGIGNRPEIERSDLCDILLHSLAPDTIQWVMKLLKVEEAPENKVRLFFDGLSRSSTSDAADIVDAKNDGVVVCDFVVGADGAWSKVRSSLTSAVPVYTGVSFWEVNHPASSSADRKNGQLFALDTKGGVIIAHTNTNGIHAYVGERCENGSSMRSVADILKGWHPDLLAIANSNTPPICRELHALPIESRWVRQADAHWTHRVAIIGDAAHLMSPMAGEGANLALADAADLAAVLARGKSIAYFEQRYMFRRAQSAATESDRNLQLFFNKGAGADVVTRIFRDMFTVTNMVKMAYQASQNVWEDLLWAVGWRVPIDAKPDAS